jgi:hypothetical protein
MVETSRAREVGSVQVGLHLHLIDGGFMGLIWAGSNLTWAWCALNAVSGRQPSPVVEEELLRWIAARHEAGARHDVLDLTANMRGVQHIGRTPAGVSLSPLMYWPRGVLHLTTGSYSWMPGRQLWKERLHVCFH